MKIYVFLLFVLYYILSHGNNMTKPPLEKKFKNKNKVGKNHTVTTAKREVEVLLRFVPQHRSGLTMSTFLFVPR